MSLRPVAVVVALGLACASPARADPHATEDHARHEAAKHQPRWDPAWSQGLGPSYGVAVVAATTFGFLIGARQAVSSPLRWTNPTSLDTAARSALRASDRGVAVGIDAASWVLLVCQIAYPVVVDVPYAWTRYGAALAQNLFWQDAATLFVAGALDAILRDVVGRARPAVYDCLEAGGTDCLESPESTRSFPGGHFMVATAASVLTCVQHLHVRLYGGPWDGLTCALTLASDATVGVFRLVSDSHWLTDELAGAAIGALVGWGVPWLLSFRHHTPGAFDEPGPLVVPMPMAFHHGGGLGVLALF